MTQYIKKLPAVFQTVTEKKFFDATIDQVFSKKDSDLLAGYLGRRNPGSYNPITDFYLPEPTKDRTWWQLEATAYARDADATKTNIFFYEDLLEHIRQYGGNTLNEDRLFASEYYSFGPPIDYDMFINYQNYYWIEQGLPVIEITGVVYADIVGKPSFTTPVTATPANFTLSTGMYISLVDDPLYTETHVVENLGGCSDNGGGIVLVPLFPDFTSGSLFEFLPWDGSAELSTGRVIDNYIWDSQTWEVQASPGNGDYITIERGSIDRNAWSRTNKWFHIDTINAAVTQLNIPFPANASRALRPIIQFIANLDLYNSGTQFREEIQYGFRDGVSGLPLLLTDFQNQQLSYLNTTYSISLDDGDLVCFFNDAVSFDSYDTMGWDLNGTEDWDAGVGAINEFIYQANVQLDGSVVFLPYTSFATPVLNGDIVFVTEDGPFNGAQRGQSWYFDNGVWLQATNDKISTNQPPLFQLYDHNGVPLDDATVYPGSTFAGSKIFSYKVNTTPGATSDIVLKFPIVYTGLNQTTDIVFQNNLITDRYTYNSLTPVDGYYYYKSSTSPILYNNWNLYDICDCNDIVIPPPPNCVETSKQRVIDRYTVGYGTEYQFKLSVTPYGYVFGAGAVQPLTDIIVSVNATEVSAYNAITSPQGYVFEEINNRIYVDLTAYLSTLMTETQIVPPVVEIQSYTHGLLDPVETGYFQIPQQLEANPTQLEVSEISGGDLVQQFSSIIANQIGIVGAAFGGPNSYRDSRKNRSVGSYILQNVAPALKSMLVSSSDDLDFISGIRFSQDEYTKFKNKYLTVAQQLINQEFNPVAYQNNTIVLNYWVSEILKTVNISKEFSNSFAYSFMAASGTPYSSETMTVSGNSAVSLTNSIDLSDPRNVMYIYDVTSNEELLLVNQDYEIISIDPTIDVQLNLGPGVRSFIFYLYKNPLPTYIPSTPTKLGAFGAYVPRIELDTTYAIPTNVIIGHDGSKTIAYNDYRDILLLELEKRIYNFLQNKYITEYKLPLRIENVKSGYFRETRYSREEYLEITQSYLNKWSAKNRANYRANDWVSASVSTPVNQLWKLYNYRPAVTILSAPTDLPGNWKGIFQYYYDTYCPDTRPWEMLGFSQKPNWWEFEYGAPIVNLAGQSVWPANASGNSNLYADLEAGIIRQGPSAIFNPITLLPIPQQMWARPGLSALIPVDNAGELIPVITLFGLAYSGNPYAPFAGFDDDWIYGDGAPVEQAWMSTSGYVYSLQEFMFLMNPGPYGELMWNTLGTELSPGQLTVPGIESPVLSSINWQYVENDTWFRPKNENQLVHAEVVDGEIQIRFGYQTWISDRILFLGKDIASTFGQKIRTLDVNLANKLAGFTNKDTTEMYIESVAPGATSTTLIVPATNFDVKLHKSPPIKTYSYSGVIIRALEDGTFIVYGYDLLNAAFTVLDRANDKLIDVSVGGTPVDFQYYESGSTYSQGDIVRYNGVYYESRTAQTVVKFDSNTWIKLKSLPVTGGISVTYKPVSAQTVSVIPYGTILKTPQAVFDLLIGWGAYLESEGWQFTEVNQDTNILSDWLSSAKQFLFWLNTNWAPDASIQLSPLANKATLIVQRGYPNDIESRVNGVYSVLDKYGVAIPPNATVTDRDGQMISAAPADLTAGGIYFLQVSASETEHILIFDNVTNFGDTIYLPLLRARQQRIRFNGFRSNGWYGKMEAPGYLIIDDQMVPNFDTIVESMRYFYDPNVTIDNPSLEDLGRHLIGYESKSYLDNLEVANDVQYLFYQGAIRQKGTSQSFDKLFRSTKIQSDEIIEVYEEWALKLGDFGNTVEQVSTEFRLVPEQNTGEVIVARLNFVPSAIGGVRLINVLNAENIYTMVPRVVIAQPDATPPTWTDFNLSTDYEIGSIVRYFNAQGNAIFYSSTIQQNAPAAIPGTSGNWETVLATRIAKAYIVLDSIGRISRIDITDPGYGYTMAPDITIDSGTESHDLDKLYSVWQGEVVHDDTQDNIVDIDIDEVDKWVVRPLDPEIALEFPITNNISYPIPNAGYVNFNDVDFTAFSANDAALVWGTSELNPGEGDTIWIAKTFIEDWNVYKLVNSIPLDWTVKSDESGNLLLLTTYSVVPLGNVYIVPELWDPSAGIQTDFGNLIVLQQVDVLGNVIAANNYTLAITPYTTEDYGNPGTWTDPDTLTTYNAYSIVTLDGTPVTASDIGTFEDFTDLLFFKTMRNCIPLPTYVSVGELIWADSYGVDLKWNVLKIESIAPDTFTAFRQQESLIDTSLFENASVFAASGTELIRLPVYDPFKNILPGLARQNITYMSLQDPAKYNVTGDDRLFSENINFGPAQVGQLWWDLSFSRVVYYEQPIALDGSETPLDNLIYRRDRWAQLFPGSVVDIYEWVQSDVPPAGYTGSGVPRDDTTYVQISTSNRFTGVTETYYYFWVLGSTNLSNAENRSLAAIDVARLLQNPKSRGYTFFAPIQQTDINNSYMFYNVQEVLAYRGNNIQVQYRIGKRDDQEHTQWSFFREGDSTSYITDQYWDKMVDSLCGYTELLPPSDEFKNAILIADSVPWDIYGWDLSTWDASAYGQILPVPDPTLSEGEKYGIEYRPRQGMFVNLLAARKVFVQSANSLLQYIPVRDDTPAWDTDVETDDYWSYTNWHAVGYENAVPTSVYTTLLEANIALSAGQLQVGDITQVTDGTVDGRYILYAVVQPNPNLPTLSLIEVVIENSAIKLLDTVYTTRNRYDLSVELRQILNAFRSIVMVDEYIVDQNELFFSMLNFVVSEQKNPDWVFKSSYIYIKENNLPLVQSTIYSPSQINNVIAYINDTKPYHTQIRDYTRSYLTTDIATGTALEEATAYLSDLTQFDLDSIQPWDNDPWDGATLIDTIVIIPPL